MKAGDRVRFSTRGGHVCEGVVLSVRAVVKVRVTKGHRGTPAGNVLEFLPQQLEPARG